MARKQPPLTSDVFNARYRSEASSRKLVDLFVAALRDRDWQLSFHALAMSYCWSTIPYRPRGKGPRKAFMRGMSPAHRQLIIDTLRRCSRRRSIFFLKIRVMLGDRVSVAGLIKRIQRARGRKRLLAISVLNEIRSPASTKALHQLAARLRSKELQVFAIEGLVRRGDFSRTVVLEAELRTATSSGFIRRGNLAANLLFAGSQLGAEAAAAILAAETSDDYRELERTWRLGFRRGALVTDWRADLRQHIEQVLGEILLPAGEGARRADEG